MFFNHQQYGCSMWIGYYLQLSPSNLGSSGLLVLLSEFVSSLCLALCGLIATEGQLSLHITVVLSLFSGALPRNLGSWFLEQGMPSMGSLTWRRSSTFCLSATLQMIPVTLTLMLPCSLLGWDFASFFVTWCLWGQSFLWSVNPYWLSLAAK